MKVLKRITFLIVTITLMFSISLFVTGATKNRDDGKSKEALELTAKTWVE